MIVTSVQHNSELHSKAYRELLALAKKTKEQVYILPLFYNKKAFSAAVEDDNALIWPIPEDRITFENFNLIADNKTAMLYGGCHVLPTAKHPVSAAADLNNGEEISIIASPKLQRKELPRISGNYSRSVALTTGTLTLPNYLSSRAGSVAEKSHRIGAVWIKGDQAMQLEYSEALGWDYDFSACVLGDIHAESVCEIALKKTLAECKKHGVDYLVLHDLFDCRAVNPHEATKPSKSYKNFIKNWNVENDLHEVKATLEYFSRELPNAIIYIVASNHDDMLSRWIESNPVLTPDNEEIFYYLKNAQLKAIREHEPFNALQCALGYIGANLKKVEFLGLNDSLLIHGVECSQHGHKGLNGARSGLQKIGQKMIVGHCHSASRLDDFFTVGCLCKLDQMYNQGGGTSWTHTSAFICESGRVVLFDTI